MRHTCKLCVYFLSTYRLIKVKHIGKMPHGPMVDNSLFTWLDAANSNKTEQGGASPWVDDSQAYLCWLSRECVRFQMSGSQW